MIKEKKLLAAACNRVNTALSKLFIGGFYYNDDFLI